MADKRTQPIRGQATSDLIPGKTDASIEEAITAALGSGNATPPMRIRRGENDNQFRLELQRNVRFSTGGMYNQLTREQLDTIIGQHFANRQNAFANWVAMAGNDNTPFLL